MPAFMRKVTCHICGDERETTFQHKDICDECAVWEFAQDHGRGSLTSESIRTLRKRARRLAKAVGIGADGRKWYLDEAGQALDFGEAL